MYEKQDFKNGDILDAAQLEAMEDGIIEAQSSGGGGTKLYKHTISFQVDGVNNAVLETLLPFANPLDMQAFISQDLLLGSSFTLFGTKFVLLGKKGDGIYTLSSSLEITVRTLSSYDVDIVTEL